MENVIECKNLTHWYGKKMVFEDLNFTVKKGRIFGLLGKNGTGKTTTINILMGFLRPTGGKCVILGEDSHKISPKTRSKIGLLHEGHIQYEFMTISQIEKFYSAFYPNWKRKFYYGLIDKMEVSHNHKISRLSCGQRSQVALGLILAQDPEIMILDDYSMGLDAGYRMLFVDYLHEYIRENGKSVFMTSHIIQDLEKIIDDTIILGYQNIILNMSVRKLLDDFHRYNFATSNYKLLIEPNAIVKNFEIIKNKASIYSFRKQDEVENYLKQKNVPYEQLKEIPMSLEEAFIGLTGKY